MHGYQLLLRPAGSSWEGEQKVTLKTHPANNKASRTERMDDRIGAGKRDRLFASTGCRLILLGEVNAFLRTAQALEASEWVDEAIAAYIRTTVTP